MISKKKGEITLNNTLSILIAVIGLAILIFGFVKLWQANTNEENKSAQKTIDGIVAKIDALEDDEGNTFLIQSFKGSEKWYLVSWNKDEDSRPNKCSFNNCLCICKGYSTESCQDSGFCRNIDNSISMNYKTVLNNRGLASVVTSCTYIGVIPLAGSILKEIDIQKENTQTNITFYSQYYRGYIDSANEGKYSLVEEVTDGRNGNIAFYCPL